MKPRTLYCQRCGEESETLRDWMCEAQLSSVQTRSLPPSLRGRTHEPFGRHAEARHGGVLDLVVWLRGWPDPREDWTMKVEITIRGEHAMILGWTEVEALVDGGRLYAPGDCVTVPILLGGVVAGGSLRFLDREFELTDRAMGHIGKVKAPGTVTLHFDGPMFTIVS